MALIHIRRACPDDIAGLADVENLLVHPEWRRMGIGRRLMERIDAECVRHGYRDVALCVDVQSDPARRLYESCGFRPAARDTIPDVCEEVQPDGSVRRWTAIEMVMVKHLAG